jgi:hypothetical protein
MTDTVQKTLSCRIGDIVEKISGCSNIRTKLCNMDVLEYFRLYQRDYERPLNDRGDPVVSDDEITKEVKHWIKLDTADRLPSRRSGISYARYRLEAIQ